MTFKQKLGLVRSYGFFAGERDYSVNPEFDGVWMVCDGNPEGWAIVGPRLLELLNETISAHELT